VLSELRTNWTVIFRNYFKLFIAVVTSSLLQPGCPWSWKVMEFRKTILQAWKVMENSRGHGKSWKMMITSWNLYY